VGVSWAVIVPLVLFFAGLAMTSVGWAMVEDDPAGALLLKRLRETSDIADVAKLAAATDVLAAELRALGLHRAAFLIDSGPILSIVGAVLGVVACAAVLTVG
jgi:hypothetical protein